MVLSFNVILGLFFYLLIRLYLTHFAISDKHLGFYQVSITILTSYVGMVFNAMSSDFFPRLTSVINNDSLSRKLVNKQIEITLLVVIPLIVLFYLLGDVIIKLLYSVEFLEVGLILKFGLLSIFFKAIVWPLDYIVLAKGNKKQYFKQQLLGDVLNLVLTILLYELFGLIGIGVSLSLNFILSGSYLVNYVIKTYNYSFSKQSLKVVIYSAIIVFASCLISTYTNSVLFNIIILLSSLGYSYKELKIRMK